MKVIERIKNVGFWVSLAAAVVLILQAFGITVDIPEVNAAVNSVCTVLVMLGILNNPTEGKGYFDLDALSPLEESVSAEEVAAVSASAETEEEEGR